MTTILGDFVVHPSGPPTARSFLRRSKFSTKSRPSISCKMDQLLIQLIQFKDIQRYSKIFKVHHSFIFVPFPRLQIATGFEVGHFSHFSNPIFSMFQLCVTLQIIRTDTSQSTKLFFLRLGRSKELNLCKHSAR